MGENMKYLIVSIYDSGYGFSICDNGKVIFESEEEYLTYVNFDVDFREWLKNKYKDYDLIIICEDGGTQVVVDRTKL
jgi:hypothetical protein